LYQTLLRDSSFFELLLRCDDDLAATVRQEGGQQPGERLADERREARETRSYEAEHVGGLWHLDFHHGSLKILNAQGEWVRPVLLAILDDRSRRACHAQWYLSETAASLVHGLAQTFHKRGLPRARSSPHSPDPNSRLQTLPASTRAAEPTGMLCS
jgi:hypothetical protein